MKQVGNTYSFRIQHTAWNHGKVQALHIKERLAPLHDHCLDVHLARRQLHHVEGLSESQRVWVEQIQLHWRVHFQFVRNAGKALWRFSLCHFQLTNPSLPWLEHANAFVAHLHQESCARPRACQELLPGCQAAGWCRIRLHRQGPTNPHQPPDQAHGRAITRLTKYFRTGLVQKLLGAPASSARCGFRVVQKLTMNAGSNLVTLQMYCWRMAAGKEREAHMHH